ncbi:MAG: hypothetical protein Q9168_001234 [Polycauliona sp. 1 TL-2023]
MRVNEKDAWSHCSGIRLTKNAFNELPPPSQLSSLPLVQTIVMPKKKAQKPPRPDNLPTEPADSVEQAWYAAPNRVWFVRKGEIGKEGDDESREIEHISVEYVRKYI